MWMKTILRLASVSLVQFSKYCLLYLRLHMKKGIKGFMGSLGGGKYSDTKGGGDKGSCIVKRTRGRCERVEFPHPTTTIELPFRLPSGAASGGSSEAWKVYKCGKRAWIIAKSFSWISQTLRYLHHVSCIMPDTKVSVKLQALVSRRELQRQTGRTGSGEWARLKPSVEEDVQR